MNEYCQTNMNFFLKILTKHLITNCHKIFLSKLKSSFQNISKKSHVTRYKNTKIFFITKTLVHNTPTKKSTNFKISKYLKLSLRFIMYRLLNKVNKNILNYWCRWINKVQARKHQLDRFKLLLIHLNKTYLIKKESIFINKCFYQWKINICSLILNESKLQYKQLVENIKKEKEREVNLKIIKEYFEIFKQKCLRLIIIERFINMKIEIRNKKIKSILMKLIKEYENILHKNFVYFYYRGIYKILVLMQNNSEQKICDKNNNNINNNLIENTPKDNPNNSTLSSSQYNTLTTISTTNNLENTTELNQNDEFNKKRSFELRKVLKKKMNEKKIILQKYFKRFHLNGICTFVKTKTISSHKDNSEIKERILHQYHKSHTLTPILMKRNLSNGITHKKLTARELKIYNNAINEERHLEILNHKFKNIIFSFFQAKIIVLKKKFTQWNLKSQYVRLLSIGVIIKLKKKKRKKNHKTILDKNDIIEIINEEKDENNDVLNKSIQK